MTGFGPPCTPSPSGCTNTMRTLSLTLASLLLLAAPATAFPAVGGTAAPVVPPPAPGGSGKPWLGIILSNAGAGVTVQRVYPASPA
jgi:hypothetical protein